MSKAFWTWALMGAAIVLIGSYGVLKFMGRELSMSMQMPQQGMPEPPASIKAHNGHNPLLTADKVAVTRWFPGHCFAELYVKDPSFDGRMIPGCVVEVIEQVKAETGVTLTEVDIRSPEVLAHFKQVYGAGNPWRQ